ncbi:RHS domain-containing protein [Serratia fonticola]
MYWYQNDHLGTPHSLTGSQGNTVWQGRQLA